MSNWFFAIPLLYRARRQSEVGIRVFNRGFVLVGLVLILLLLASATTGPQRSIRSVISPDEFVRAVVAHRTSVIDLYLNQNLDPNARALHDRPLIVAAAMAQDWRTVRRLLQAGACPDLGDADGMTTLMVAAEHGEVAILRELIGIVTSVDIPDRFGYSALQYAILARKTEAVQFLLPFMPDLGRHGSNLLVDALDSRDTKIVDAVLERMPPLKDWSTSARHLLEKSIIARDYSQASLLLKKHVAPPTPEGRNVPLLAHAIVRDEGRLLHTLLACGADPNTVLPLRCDNDFLALINSKGLRNWIADDGKITVLMVASALGRPEFVQALLEAGADRTRRSARYRMLALYLAAQNGYWRCAQLLLGSGLPPEQLRLEITLASQKVALIKDGVPIFNTTCSTGRGGRFATRTGDYVITDKDRYHVSTIYKVEMPYFMRLNCLDFGMHEGYVPAYPASHGCIRLPSDAARKFFDELPLGTLVSVK